MGWLLALHSNIRLGRKDLSGANTLALFELSDSDEGKKSCITLASEGGSKCLEMPKLCSKSFRNRIILFRFLKLLTIICRVCMFF